MTEKLAIAELLRQADAYGPDAPYVDEDMGEGKVLIDGKIDLAALIAALGIPWKPISDMPEDRKDGRPMLLAAPNRISTTGALDADEPWLFYIARWEPRAWIDRQYQPGWRTTESYQDDAYEIAASELTHWTDINPPE
jgi:hypothetical protein